MLIYNQCWKNVCCLIFFGICDIFQDALRNKKLKKNSSYSKYKFCVTIYTTIQKFGVSTFCSYFLYFYY